VLVEGKATVAPPVTRTVSKLEMFAPVVVVIEEVLLLLCLQPTRCLHLPLLAALVVL